MDNMQEWGTRPEIWIGSELVVNSSTTNSATIELGTQHPNGLYHCSSAQSQREYFSLFVNSSNLCLCVVYILILYPNYTLIPIQAYYLISYILLIACSNDIS